MTQYENQLITELRKLNNNLSELNKELKNNRLTKPPFIMPTPNTPSTTPLPTTPTCNTMEIRYDK